MLLVAVAVAYVVLYPRLKQMSEEAARINSEVDQHNSAAPPAATNGIAAIRAEAEANPLDYARWERLAIALRDSGQLAEAEKAALTAVNLRPKEPGPLLLLGDIQHRAKLYDLAITTYRSVLDADPKNAEGAAALGWLYISLGWTSEAHDLLDKAARVNPADPHLQVALALTDLQASDLGRAENALLAVRKSHPGEVALWGPLVDVYLKGKRPKDALQISTEALQLAPRDVKLLNGLGQAQYDSGDFASALATFQKAIELDGGNIEAHHRSALCFRAMSKPLDAIREMEYVYQRSPDYEQTRQTLGQLYSQNGRGEEGQRLLAESRKAVAAGEAQARAGYLLLHQPKSPEAHYKMALVYRDQKDVSRMIVELSRTVELDPKYHDAQRLLTDALRQRNAAGGK